MHNQYVKPTCPRGSTEEHLTTDQRVVGSNPIVDDFFHLPNFYFKNH